MNIGLLWSAKSGTDITDSVRAAGNYFLNKYKKKPDTCHINMEQFIKEFKAKSIVQIDGMLIIGSELVQPNHYWIGIDKEETDYKQK